MSKLFLVFILFVFGNLSAQDYSTLNNTGFKKARVKFLKGYTYTGTAYIQHNNIFLPNSAYHKKIEFIKVKSIEIPKGSFVFEGLLVGAAVGTVVYLIAKYAHKEEEKFYIGSSVVVEQNPFPGFAFLGILGGFTLVGTIVGKSTSKWSTIYTKESGNLKSSLYIIPTLNSKKGLALNFRYRL